MRKHRYYFRNILAGLFAVFAISIVVMFGWNSFAPELFGLSIMHFKQAFGLVLFTAAITLVIKIAHNKIRHQTNYHEEGIQL